jgi:hypothetical protein
VGRLGRLGRLGRRGAITGLGLLALVTGALSASTMVASGSGAQVRQHATTTTFPPGPQGVNFTMHPDADQNFCVSNITGGELALSIQQCGPVDSQHWTFAQSADNSSVLVDGNGQCLETASKPNKLAQINPCTFLSPEHFVYKENTGKIQSVSGKLCLQDATAADNASLFFTACVKGLVTQVWVLGH